MEPIVIIDTKEMSAQPGLPVVIGLRIKNKGTRNTAYDLSVVGVPDTWVSISPQQVRPKEREADAATAVLTITPPMGPEAPAGPVPFGVKATSTVDGSSAVDEGVMVVAGAGGLDVVPVVTQKTGRWRSKFPIELHNSGNAEIRVALVPFDATDETALEMDREIVNLAPQASTSVTLKAKMRSPSLRGAPKARPLVVAVHSHERGADMKRPGQPVPPGSDPLHREVPLMLTQSPILSKAVMALGGLLIVGLLALVAYRNFLYSDREPEIAAPTQGPAVIHEPQAGAISVQWERVSGVDGYLLEVRSPSTGLERIPLSSDVNSHLLGGLSPSEQYQITLTPVADETNGFSTSFTEQPNRPELAKPTAVAAQPTGSGTEHMVSWTFDDPAAVTFGVLVDGRNVTGPIIGQLTTSIMLDPGERTVAVQVVSADDPSRTGLSDPITVSVAAPPEADPETGNGNGNGQTDTTDGNGNGAAQVTDATSEHQAEVAENPFLVVLSVGFQTPQGGLDGASAIGEASTFEILLGLEVGDVPVVALPAASYSLSVAGQSGGTGTAEGWVVGAAHPTVEAAQALCDHPAWGTNAALQAVQATYGCLILQVN